MGTNILIYFIFDIKSEKSFIAVAISVKEINLTATKPAGSRIPTL